MSQEIEEFIFRAKTKEAFVIKILGELLSNSLRTALFNITEKGIFLLQTDPKREQMIDISLLKENFSIYKCVKPFTFTINSNHFYRMLKHIKKKDGITLFIKESDELTLGICVEQADENNKVTTYIRITPARPEDIDRPEGYENPIIMSSKEFQKMKNLHNIANEITVTSKLNYIKFFCDGGSLYSRELIIGNENDDENKHITKFYKQRFSTTHITALTKCAGQSQPGNIQVFVHEDFGMKIKMKAGSLGDIIVYIKSLEIIEDELDEALDTVEDDQDDVSRPTEFKIDIDEEDEEPEVKPKPIEKVSKKSPKKKPPTPVSDDEDDEEQKVAPKRKTKKTTK